MSSSLRSDYTFDTNMLVNPIRNVSVIRQLGIPISTVIPIQDKLITFEQVTDDFVFAMGPDPIEVPRSDQSLDEYTKKVNTIFGGMSYGYDELLRINSGSLPFNARANLLAEQMAYYEDALALAYTTTGVPDGDAIPFVQGGTSQSFTIDTYDHARTNIGTGLGVLASNMNKSLKNYSVKLLINKKAYQTAMGLSNANTDKDIFTVWNDAITTSGGPGSGIVVAPTLGAAVTVSNKKLVVTQDANEAIALMAIARDGSNMWIGESVLDARPNTPDKQVGLKLNLVRRWFPYVFQGTAILYDIAAGS